MSEATRTRFIIIGMARSGTTVTHLCLYGHPNVCAMVDEIRVAPFYTQGCASFTVGGKNVWEREHGYLNLFDAITIYRAPGGVGDMAYTGTPEHPKGDILANGMKVATNSAEDAHNLVDSLVQYFKGIKVVYVRREDWLAQFASLQLARQSGKWHSWTKVKDESKKPTTIEIDKNQFAAYIKQGRELEAQFARLRDTHEICDVSYERDIAGESLACAHRMFEFVGVQPIDPTWLHSKKVSPPVEEFVVNHAEMRTLLESLRGDA